MADEARALQVARAVAALSELSEPAVAEALVAPPTIAAAVPAGVQEPVGVADSPGLADIRAGVGLVEAGLAARVSILGLRSWPGLLWQISELAQEAGVDIVPTTVHGDGRVDIEITRTEAVGG